MALPAPAVATAGLWSSLSTRGGPRVLEEADTFLKQGEILKKLALSATAFAIAVLTNAPVVQAQTPSVLKMVQLGAAGGSAIPLSDFGNGYSSGYNLTGILGVNPTGMPLGLRFDAAYNQFPAKGGIKINAKVASFSGNAVFSVPGAQVSPYLIGGIGYYHTSSSVAGTSASNNVGFNGGAGLSVPLTGFSVFLEARYHHYSDNGTAVSFIPITVGVLF